MLLGGVDADPTSGRSFSPIPAVGSTGRAFRFYEGVNILDFFFFSGAKALCLVADRARKSLPLTTV